MPLFEVWIRKNRSESRLCFVHMSIHEAKRYLFYLDVNITTLIVIYLMKDVFFMQSSFNRLWNNKLITSGFWLQDLGRHVIKNTIVHSHPNDYVLYAMWNCVVHILIRGVLKQYNFSISSIKQTCGQITRSWFSLFCLLMLVLKQLMSLKGLILSQIHRSEIDISPSYRGLHGWLQLNKQAWMSNLAYA